jgi:hypothetical protein
MDKIINEKLRKGILNKLASIANLKPRLLKYAEKHPGKVGFDLFDMDIEFRKQFQQKDKVIAEINKRSEEELKLLLETKMENLFSLNSLVDKLIKGVE